MAMRYKFNPLNAELNNICHFLALLGGATIVVVIRLRVNLVTHVQRPLVIDRRDGTERNLNEITAGSR
jgi:hypothetical protein